MNKEMGIIHDFFKFITFVEESAPGDSNKAVYRELVYYRFFETIKSIFPITVQNLDADLLNHHIKTFIGRGARSGFIRDMSDEFRHYLLNQNEMKLYSWLEDLMWYEWTECVLLTSPMPGRESIDIDFRNKYELSQSSVVKTVSHEVYKNPLNAIEQVDLILYYDFSKHKVCYQTITKFIRDIILNTDETSLESAFQNASKNYGLNSESIKEARSLVLEVVRDLARKKILVVIAV